MAGPEALRKQPVQRLSQHLGRAVTEDGLRPGVAAGPGCGRPMPHVQPAALR
ncbi:Hypothetical protein AA314_07622 [Archangium gephyra]|uniref:Uncharacterized protein n=1 Tax=Archangium gephyra TaxID=48 RepID=A0AAC8QEC8_9BACT|nr:Hypothetical protein AA314_07622 [Archangium gephyra]